MSWSEDWNLQGYSRVAHGSCAHPKQKGSFVAILAKGQAWILATFVCLGAATEPAAGGPSLVFDPATGNIISQDRAGMPWYPASLTKLMTAYLTFQALREKRLTLEQKIPVSWLAARQPPSKIGVQAGGSVSVDFALQALLVHSANDIAVALAEAVGGNLPTFIVQMNKAASELGMSGTRFLNPNGLHDPHHYSTARDMALLASAVHARFPEYRRYFSQDYMQVGKRKLRNRNALLRQMPEADGMKTGYICASGFNLVASASIEGRRLMAVVLGASNGRTRADWAQNLLMSGAAISAGSRRVREISNLLPSEGVPPDLSEEICGGGRGLELKPATALKGHGVSLGRFEERQEALKALRIWSDSGDAYTDGASKSLVQLPSSGHRAIVWNLEEGEAQSFCEFLKERSVACEVLSPRALEDIARQAKMAAAAKKAVKKRKKKKN